LREVYQTALPEKVAFCPGAAFYTSQEQEVAAMRLNCSRPSEEALVKGLQVLGRLLNERERRDRREQPAARGRRFWWGENLGAPMSRQIH